MKKYYVEYKVLNPFSGNSKGKSYFETRENMLAFVKIINDNKQYKLLDSGETKND